MGNRDLTVKFQIDPMIDDPPAFGPSEDLIQYIEDVRKSLMAGKQQQA